MYVQKENKLYCHPNYNGHLWCKVAAQCSKVELNFFEKTLTFGLAEYDIHAKEFQNAFNLIKKILNYSIYFKNY